MKKYFLAISALIISVLLIIMATGFEFENLESLMKPPMVVIGVLNSWDTFATKLLRESSNAESELAIALNLSIIS